VGNINIIMVRCGDLSQTLNIYKINKNMSFTGEYNNIIDQKNRLSIPVKFRKSLGIKNNKTFVLTRGFDECLFLYPLEEWKIVEKQLSSLSTIKGKNRIFIRSIVRYANYLKYDSQGRIQIPENLLKFSNIQKNVAIIGVIKKIEIWNPETLSKYEVNKEILSNEDFDNLATEINF